MVGLIKGILALADAFVQNFFIESAYREPVVELIGNATTAVVIPLETVTLLSNGSS